MAKRVSRRKKAPRRASVSQRVMQVLGLVIVLSMALAVLAPLAGGGQVRRTPTPAPPEPTATFRPVPTATQLPSPTPGAAVAPTPNTDG